jgi:hypothetical protein
VCYNNNVEWLLYRKFREPPCPCGGGGDGMNPGSV